jgi:glutamate dehydrogenase (NAD(P)+)
MNIDDVRPQLVCEVSDGRLGTVGYLVIDRALGNAAIGGIRMAPNVTLEEVAYLARAMTLKCSFLNLWVGGAKAGITASGPLVADRRREVLEAFGRGLGPILRTGIYIAGEDLGISAEDLDIVLQAAGLPKVAVRTDSPYYTGLTVVETIRQALVSRGCSLNASTVAIEGFGRVGSNVATLLASEGARIVAVSTCEGAIYNPRGLDVEQLIALRRKHGDHFVNESTDAERLDLADLLLLDVNILVPCARPWTISDKNAGQVRAGVVVPGGNIAVTPSAERALFGRGILYLPGFIANCGGVFAASMVAKGFLREDIESVIETEFARRVARVLDKAQASGAMPSEVAREAAWQNFQHSAWQMGHEQRGARALMRKALQRGARASLERGAAILYGRGLRGWSWVHRLALANARKGLGAEEPLA